MSGLDDFEGNFEEDSLLTKFWRRLIMLEFAFLRINVLIVDFMMQKITLKTVNTLTFGFFKITLFLVMMNVNRTNYKNGSTLFEMVTSR